MYNQKNTYSTFKLDFWSQGMLNLDTSMKQRSSRLHILTERMTNGIKSAKQIWINVHDGAKNNN